MKLPLATISLGLAILPELALAGFSASCDWDWMNPRFVVANCRRKNGSYLRTRQDMNLCITNNNGFLQGKDNGNAFGSCYNTKKYGLSTIESECDGGGGYDEGPTYFNLDTIMENNDGYLWCYGHRSAPYSG